jgi:hypothetical protein
MHNTDPVALSARQIVDRINGAWLNNDPEQIRDYVHPDVVMAIPGFVGSSRGAQQFVAGFAEFCNSARIKSYSESDHYADSVGQTSVVSCRFDMVYERLGVAYRCTGRDLWVFAAAEGGVPTAVWRTMLDLQEEPVAASATDAS